MFSSTVAIYKEMAVGQFFSCQPIQKNQDQYMPMNLVQVSCQKRKSASITVPNGSAQQRLIKTALEEYGVKPSDVDCIEAHRTGTALGNPIVIEALAEVFAQPKTKFHPLMVGSVKSNIGHLECAAGIVGLIKAALILTQEYTPPTLASTT